MSFCYTEFPSAACVLDGTERRSARSSFVTADQNDVSVRFGNPGGDRADPGLCHQFHANFGPGIDLFEVVYELGQIFDGINVMVRRRRNQHHSRSAFSEPGNEFGDFMAWKLTSFAWLRALSHFDLDLFRGRQIGGGDAEAALCNLFDRAIWPISVFPSMKSFRIFPAFTRIRFAADLIHRDRQAFVRLRAKRAK